MQLGFSCKKGVGGTYPARCAARRLQHSGQRLNRIPVDVRSCMLPGSLLALTRADLFDGAAGVLPALLDELPPTAGKATPQCADALNT